MTALTAAKHHMPLIIYSLLASLPLAAKTPAPLWQGSSFGVPLDTKRPITKNTAIRVKIFPHRFSYPPHGKDLRTHKVTLRAPQSCRQYAGLKKRSFSRGKVVRRGQIFTFRAKDLSSPVYLRCKGRVKLLRAKPLKSYEYVGSFYIRKNKKGQVEVVNLLSIKQYLKGVVPSEVFSGWPLETLKAQAVAARTYAVYHLSQSRRNKRNRFYDVDDTIAFQAYTGVSHQTSRTDLAVNETKGQILTFGGHVIQAFFHADSGGQTEDAENVWQKKVPYCRSKKEVFTTKKPTNAWRRRMSYWQITKKLRKRGVIGRKDVVKKVVAAAAGRTFSGRVKKVVLELRGKRLKAVSYSKFARSLGSRRFPSRLFEFYNDRKRKRVTFSGRGFGHGVGMNQMGAFHLAKKEGWGYRQILDFYYTNVKMCQLSRVSVKLAGCYDLQQKYKRKRQFTQNIPPKKPGFWP